MAKGRRAAALAVGAPRPPGAAAGRRRAPAAALLCAALLCAALLCAALVPGPARAEASGLAPFLACAAKADDAERLACYDAAAASVSAEARALAAERARARRAAEEAQAEEAARRASQEAARAAAAQADRFGRESLPAGRGEPAAAAAAPLERLSARVGEALLDQRGRTVFLLENGQMWRQTEGTLLPPVRPGDSVEIARSALGGYRLLLPRVRRSVPVVRVR